MECSSGGTDVVAGGYASKMRIQEGGICILLIFEGENHFVLKTFSYLTISQVHKTYTLIVKLHHCLNGAFLPLFATPLETMKMSLTTLLQLHEDL